MARTPIAVLYFPSSVADSTVFSPASAPKNRLVSVFLPGTIASDRAGFKFSLSIISGFIFVVAPSTLQVTIALNDAVVLSISNRSYLVFSVSVNVQLSRVNVVPFCVKVFHVNPDELSVTKVFM